MEFWLGLTLGFVIGILLVGFATTIMIKNAKQHQGVKGQAGKRTPPAVFGGLLFALFMLTQLVVQGGVLVSHAQEETLVPLVIPINPIMIATNNWLLTFAPIAAIGIGIGLALAVLGYIGKMIQSAFR